MIAIDAFNPKKTSKLFGLNRFYDLIKSLHNTKKFPKVLLLSGKKGIGKFTMINHFLNYVFNKSNYNINENSFSKKNKFYTNFIENIHPNIIYLSGTHLKNLGVQDIRNLKTNILKTPIENTKRYIILDDIEVFNLQSLNAILKIIEEPGIYNYFILINNESTKLLETVRSRCIEIKVILNEFERIRIIKSLSEYFQIKIILDFNYLPISPGNFIKFNYFISENKIDINENLMLNINKIVNFYRKEKDEFFVHLIFFIIDYYFKFLNNNNYINEKLINDRSFIIKNLRNYFFYNLNHDTLLNSLDISLNNG